MPPALTAPLVPSITWADGAVTPEFQPYSDGRRYTYVPVYNQVWTTWNTTAAINATIAAFDTLTTVATVTTEIWDNWNRTWVISNRTGNTATQYTVNQRVVEVAPDMAATQRRAREAAQAEHQAALARQPERLVRATAADRAWATLEEMISEDQRQQLRTDRKIIVPVEGYEFHIHADRGASANVWVYENGTKIGTLCAHPVLYPDRDKPAIPQGDVVLAQVLAIKADPADFVAKAIVHYGRKPVLGAGPVTRQARALRNDRARAA